MSKDNNSTPAKKPMTPSEKSILQKQFLADWDAVKNDVIKGTLSPEELKKVTTNLYEYRVTLAADSKTGVDQIIKDCKSANISDENLHKFVSAALSLELDVEKTKKNSPGLMRSSFGTLAGPLLSYEASKRGFGDDILKVVKKGTDKEIIDAFIDMKIPSYLKDHYTPIINHYKSVGGEEGVRNAFTNLIFNNLYPALTVANSAKYNSLKAELGEKHPDVKAEGDRLGPIGTKIAELSYAAYPTKGDKGASTGQSPNPAFEQTGMFDALIKQFDSNPAEQTLSQERMQEIKKKAYIRNNIRKERDKFKKKSLGNLEKSEAKKAKSKETKKEIPSKTFGQRFSEFKNEVSTQINKLRKNPAGKSNSHEQVANQDTASSKKNVTFEAASDTFKRKFEQEKYPKTSTIKPPLPLSQQQSEEKSNNSKKVNFEVATKDETSSSKTKTYSKEKYPSSKVNFPPKVAQDVEVIKSKLNNTPPARPRANAVSEGKPKTPWKKVQPDKSKSRGF